MHELHRPVTVILSNSTEHIGKNPRYNEVFQAGIIFQ